MSAPKMAPSAVGGMSLIVGRELGQYFRTWQGYIIFAALLSLSGVLFNAFAVGSTPSYSADVLSNCLFFLSGTTLTAAVLLSMRLIAEERQAGSLPLLGTSSLTEGQVVVAKFLSAFAVLGLYVGLTGYLPALVFMNGKISGGHILAGYAGLMLLGGAGVAIGLFYSALVQSQLVAALLAGVTTFGLILFWLTSRLVDGALGDVLAYLALHDKHFRPFMDGSVALQSVVYYLSVSAFFLVATRNVLEARRWRP